MKRLSAPERSVMMSEALAEVVLPIPGPRLASDDASHRAGEGLNGRQRIVDLVTQHLDQPLPRLTLLLPQRPGEIGEHHEVVRKAALPEHAAP
jgi:hypothetical protein